MLLILIPSQIEVRIQKDERSYVHSYVALITSINGLSAAPYKALNGRVKNMLYCPALIFN
jgi:hypothetical protein